MNNKVLIKLIVPSLDKAYDLFIPVNETIYKIKKLILESLNDIDTNMLNVSYVLINKINSRVYNNKEIVINTDIRNATELMLLYNFNL